MAPPDDRALDSWMRGAPLELSTDLALTEPIEIWVVSRPADGEGREELLSTGATSFDGPDHPGLNVVTASVTTESHGPSQHAWLVETPDRSGGPELLLDIPGPRLELVSASGSVSGEPGHGCYAYLCVHVGYRPPLETLEVLPVAIGETLGLQLDDGSAMSGWTGTLEPLGTFATAEPARAAATFGDGARAAPRLDGLEVPAAGEWLLELRADFDRERGWQWFLYRLMAE